jgi:hypothetical protein
MLYRLGFMLGAPIMVFKKIGELPTNVRSFGQQDALSVILDKSRLHRGSNQKVSVAQWDKHSSVT